MSAPTLANPLHPSDLDPSQFADGTYGTRRFSRLDAALVFVFMICLLTLIPAQLVVKGTTDVGRPALILCMLMCFWWFVTRLNPRLTMGGRQPLRWAVGLFVVSELISYAVGVLRGLSELEMNNADQDLLFTVAFAGVILVAADGLANWERLHFVVKTFVWCAVYMSVVGLSQEILPINIVDYISIPGLTLQHALAPLQQRGSGLRVPSTTSHYIELATTLALAFPFALHYTMFSPTKKMRQAYFAATLLIVFGIAATISRSGIIAIIICMLVLAPLWNWRLRYNLFAVAMTLLVGLSVAQPTLMHTFIDIFTGANTDPSITSRTERYGLVAYYFDQRPWLGRGAGTWVWPEYQFLDNQWLDTALQNGLLGVAALVTLHIIAIVCASLAVKRATTPEDKHFCLALIGIQVAAMVVAYTYDAFSFTTYAIMLGVSFGLCGAVWRFTHPAREVRTLMPRDYVAR